MSGWGPKRFTRADPLGLTWAERRLYDVLAAAGAETLPPQEIARRAWAPCAIVAADEQLVRQHIANIRRKLGADAIEAHRGRGYRLAQGRAPARGEAAS